MTSIKQYDIIISGGGVAGCLTALSILKHTNYSVLLIEAFANEKTDKPAGFDARVIALSADSLSRLNKLKVDVNSLPTAKIKKIHEKTSGASFFMDFLIFLRFFCFSMVFLFSLSFFSFYRIIFNS